MTRQLQQRTYLTALAGLLHDIGKFGQRAGETGTGESKKHAAVGDKFVNQHVPAKWRGAMAPVGWHHGDPEHPGRLHGLGLPVKIVALGDRLSSGEREELDKDSTRPKQLISIFSRIKRDRQQSDIASLHLPLKPLSLSKDNLFPKQNPLDDEQMKRDYRKLWDSFCAEAGMLAAHVDENTEIGTYLESMLNLLRKYTWSIPSAFYQANPDVSLYEHLHTTAALSACFSQEWSGQHAEQTVDRLLDSIRNQSPPSEPEVADLLVGDLSGIQSFIYSLHNAKRATSVLRARSFFIQMLVEASARYLLRQLELPITNALYVGGGGFSLIVPPLSEEQVEELSTSINDTLATSYRGELYLALAHRPLAPSDFTIGAFGDVQQGTAAILEEKKNHRFSELPTEKIRDLFSPQGHGGAEEGVCSICGQESEDLKEDDEESDIHWCTSCLSFRELGEDLRRAKYLLLSDVPIEALSSAVNAPWTNILRAFGVHVAVGEQPPVIPTSAFRSTLFSLDDHHKSEPNPHLAVGRKFLVNLVPQLHSDESLPSESAITIRPGMIKDFGVLAHQSVGVPYLGILRMDMDNLGKIFSRGLDRYSSLSRQATLSLLLSVFFEGWVGEIAGEIAANDKEQRDRLYSVYSGGDDLFFVGAWDAALELAQRVRRDLKDYTGRSDLGISGGIVLVHEKTPLYIAARQAEGAESAAKHLRKGKDSMSFLNTTLPWELFGFTREGQTATAWASKLQQSVLAKHISRSVLSVVQDVYAQYRHGKKTRGEMGPWVWRSAYWFHRALDREHDKEGKDLLQTLATLLSGEDFARNIEWLALAARWAELATRKEGNSV